MKSRADIIKLIHVGKRNLSLDDDTYRQLLANAANGKTSCRDMNITELKTVLRSMESGGFKPVRKAPKAPAIITDKISVIWRIMGQQGFILDSGDRALDAFVKRTTRVRNGGVGVARLDWLRGDQASAVLESLKKWHMRVMLEQLPNNGLKPTYDSTCKRYLSMLQKVKP